MTKESKKKSLVFVIVCVCCFSLSLITSAYSLLSYHVKNGNTIPYYIDKKISDAGVYSIVVADNQWNGIANRKVFFQQQSTRYDQTDHVKNYRFEIFPKAMGTTTTTLGETKPLNVVNGLLVEADVALNVSYPLGNDPVSSTSYSVRAIVAHEFGHVIGIGHSSYYFDNALMAKGLPKGQVSCGLKDDDISGYNHIAW